MKLSEYIKTVLAALPDDTDESVEFTVHLDDAGNINQSSLNTVKFTIFKSHRV